MVNPCKLLVLLSRLSHTSGKRKCLGESVARSTAFVFFANFIRRFRIKVL